MTYIFSGVLSTDISSASLPNDTNSMVFRKIDHPMIKSGVLFPQQAEEQIDNPNKETENLIREIGLYGISNGNWIYYMCWGGDVEAIAIANIQNSKIDKTSYTLHDDIRYTDLHKILSSFNIEIDKSGHFEPFVRNFWGEHGY